MQRHVATAVFRPYRGPFDDHTPRERRLAGASCTVAPVRDALEQALQGVRDAAARRAKAAEAQAQKLARAAFKEAKRQVDQATGTSGTAPLQQLAGAALAGILVSRSFGRGSFGFPGLGVSAGSGGRAGSGRSGGRGSSQDGGKKTGP